MDPAIFDEIDQTLHHEGKCAAVDLLCRSLREQKDYANLFYALLLKKRHELGMSPLPRDDARGLAEAQQNAYEDAIREAARLVGRLYLDDSDIPRAWIYYRMLGEPEPVRNALETYQFPADYDPGDFAHSEADLRQQIIDIAFHQGVHPRRGFDLILENYGICSTITTVTSAQGMAADLREHCIKGLVHALYDQVRQRLTQEIEGHEGKPPATGSVRELIAGRDWLFGEDLYHVDTSHLSAVVQMSIELQPSEEMELARELCDYGQRLCPRFQFPGYPPFEDTYCDYGVYLDILSGNKVEEGLAHFREKIDAVDESDRPAVAEVLVNLYLRLNKPGEALIIARRHLLSSQESLRSSPAIVELCKQAGDFRALAEIAREQDDPVHFLAGRLAEQK